MAKKYIFLGSVFLNIIFLGTVIFFFITRGNGEIAGHLSAAHSALNLAGGAIVESRAIINRQDHRIAELTGINEESGNRIGDLERDNQILRENYQRITGELATANGIIESLQTGYQSDIEAIGRSRETAADIRGLVESGLRILQEGQD